MLFANAKTMPLSTKIGDPMIGNMFGYFHLYPYSDIPHRRENQRAAIIRAQ